MDISIVIPLYNEEESLPELIEWIEHVMLQNGFLFEIILVDDGSSDNSWDIIKELAESKKFIRAINFRRNYGKSAALYCGFKMAKGEVVITMDADLQDSPDEIPELYKMIKTDGYDLVSGWKRKRYDSKIAKNIPSKFFNGITRLISGIKLHDFNCGLKAYKSKVIKTIEVYGEMHRYIPVLAKQAGFKKIGEKIVQHRARKYGVTKFGMSRFINGFLDLMSITFITKFGKKPMHFFGVIGTLMFLFGGGVAIWLIIRKIYCIANGIIFRDVTSQPLFYIALVTIIIGVQLFLAGFLGELISRNSNERNKYFIDNEI